MRYSLSLSLHISLSASLSSSSHTHSLFSFFTSSVMFLSQQHQWKIHFKQVKIRLLPYFLGNDYLHLTVKGTCSKTSFIIFLSGKNDKLNDWSIFHSKALRIIMLTIFKLNKLFEKNIPKSYWSIHRDI